MFRLALFLVCAAFCAADVPKCGENEVFKSCGSACQPSCARPEIPLWCTKQCVIGCQCADGFIRDDVTNKCVRKEECSIKACGANEVFKTCGSACPPTCDRPNTPVFCTKQCVIGCQCANGFLRDETTGQCVKVQQCTNKHQCGENEEYRTCGTACEPSCSKPNPKICTLQCVIGCQCKNGYYRDDITNKCVKKEECSVGECQDNAVFRSCGTMCPKKCSQRGNVPCPLVCVPGCECAEGLVKEDATGECKRVEECQQEECDMRTERYDRCSKACERTCDNPDSKICPMVCMPGCMCQDGLFRHSSGTCVKRTDC